MFDRFVERHPRGDVLQTSHWGRLKSRFGWQHYCLGVLERGQLVASAMLLRRPVRILGTALFYSPRGPLFGSEESLRALMAGVRSLARQERVSLWRMDPAVPVTDSLWQAAASKQLVPLTHDVGFGSTQPRLVMQLDLQPSLEQLLQAMKSKTRYNIRYACRKGVSVVRSDRSQDLELFYPLLQETAARDGFQIRSFTYFAYLWEELVTCGLAHLFLAYSGSRCLAGAICFRLGRKVCYVYGASSSQHRSLQPNYALQWAMISWAKSHGCTLYDFRGIAGNLDPKDPLYGLYRFKLGFGAELQEYVGTFDHDYAGLRARLMRTGLGLQQSRLGKVLLRFS